MTEHDNDYQGTMEGGDRLKSCPFCGEPAAAVERAGLLIQRATPGIRESVASQSPGFRVRCECCGCQTCWWHHLGEAVHSWNKRPSGWLPPEDVEELRRDALSTLDAVAEKYSSIQLKARRGREIYSVAREWDSHMAGLSSHRPSRVLVEILREAVDMIDAAQEQETSDE